MRRLFLRNDWVGYPLRKDYNADPEINPVPLESEETLDATPTFEANSHDGEVSEKENILFEEDEYVVNILGHNTPPVMVYSVSGYHWKERS